MNVSILIVSFNTAHLLPRFFESVNNLIASCPKHTFEVVVVENASQDNSTQIIKECCPAAILIENQANVGFGRANNQALVQSSSEFVLLLNTDAFVISGSFGDMLEWFNSKKNCAVAGVKLVNQDGSLQPSCRYFPTPIKVLANRTGIHRLWPRGTTLDDLSWGHDRVRYCDWVPGCFYLIRRNALPSNQLFDPKFFLYYEEVDQCFELKKRGWQVAFYPLLVVHHMGGESAKAEGSIDNASKQLSNLQIESELIYFRKWFGGLSLLSFYVTSTFVSLLLSIKHLLTGRGLSTFRLYLSTFLTTTSLLWQTKLGREPTR
jgi:N-acetylglucosaminyl-diphospho-decaprenol L-rhamnosyltransferase